MMNRTLAVRPLRNLIGMGFGAVAVAMASCSTFQPEPVTIFNVTISNVARDHGVETVISTGVAVTHNENLLLFEAGRPDTGLGLEGIAEDGQKWDLDRNLKRAPSVYDQIIFDTPIGGKKPENIGTGDSYEFYIAAKPSHPFLSLASMVGNTNDANLMLDTGGRSGYRLFRADGTPKTNEELRDVMAHWDVWDQGTEINELNGAGPNQPDAPSGLNVGAADVGVVREYEDVRHPIDPVDQAFAVSIVNVVGASPGTLRVTIRNTTNATNLLASALGPVLAVAHDPSLSLFELGTADGGQGLESLAEEGDPSRLAASLAAHGGYGRHLVAGPDRSGAPAAAPAGGTVSFVIQLSQAHPELSIAAMYVESNDVVLAFVNTFGGSGLALFGKTDAEIDAMVKASLRFVDAGTEQNEPIGAGSHQGARQNRPGAGEPERGVVRRWRVPSNPIIASDIATITIVRADGVPHPRPKPGARFRSGQGRN